MTQPVSRQARNAAVMRALPRLYDASLDAATFTDYGGHLLLALTLIATTSSDASVSATARRMALERAHHWRKGWPASRAVLSADTAMQAVIAIFACERLGIESRSIRDDLATAVRTYRTEDLLYFDASVEPIPGDVPRECGCGHVNLRGSRKCARCSSGLECLSRYEIWYYALTSVYFCEQCGIELPVTFARVLERLAELRPYPKPGSPGFYHAIYAATHLVYTLNGYGTFLLPPMSLTEEQAFLHRALEWAIAQGEADTLGELLDSLTALGTPDDDAQLTTARRLILDHQLPDGSWGGEDGDGDIYAYFHTIWAAIDGLREHAWLVGADRVKR